MSVNEFSPELPASPSDPRKEQWHRERRAFIRLLGELLPQYRGQYVAIQNEKVVDHGPDQAEVAFRVLDRLGDVPIFVSLVTDNPPVFRVPTLREFLRPDTAILVSHMIGIPATEGTAP